MAQSTQCYTQSLRYLDPVNQKRIKLNQRILWPDYETLQLLDNFSSEHVENYVDMNLSNLFLYCPFEENFLVKKTKTNQYLYLKQLYTDEFTHLAFWVCKNQNDNSKLYAEFTQNNRVIQNKRQKSLEKGYRTREKAPQYQDMYVILCKRPLAIDQIVKTSHKISISIAPLSSQKFLWGGALHYEQFESLYQQKKEQNGLFKTGGESFGFNIETKRSFAHSSYRKSNGMIDKRQQRYSNYFKAQKQQQQKSQLNNEQTKHRKQCTNRLNILPQHIRQHQQFLYIQIDLDNNSQLPQKKDQYKFISLDIYARHLRPKYGGVYQRQSSSSDQQDEYDELKGALNKYKRLLKEEIFLVYSMPFMEFNSYLESQLYFQENQQLREINFRGSCVMFSAMKKLQLKSNNSKEENKNEKSSPEKGKKQRFMEIEQEKKEQESILKCFPNKEFTQKLVKKEKSIECEQNKEIIQIIPDPFLTNTKQKVLNNKDLFKIERKKILTQLRKKFNLNQENNLHSEQQNQEIYIPVLNPEGFEPLRIGVERQFMQYLNPFIGKLIAKVVVEVSQIRKQQQDKIEQLGMGDNNRKRLSVYVGKKRGQLAKVEKQQDLIGIDVFLTDKVYKQQTVYVLINFMRQIKKLSNTINEPSTHEQCLFNELRSIEQLRNVLILLSDIKGEPGKQVKQIATVVCDDVILLLWIQMLQRLNDHNESKLQLMRQAQQSAQKLLTLTDSIKNDLQDNNYKLANENALKAQQQQVIGMIKDYHNRYTIHNDQSNFYVNLFFFFLTFEHINGAKVINYFRNNKGNHQQKQKTDKLIQTVLNDFFLTNCNSILDCHSLQLTAIITKLSQNQQSMNKQSTLLLCSMLKSTVTYVIENLSSIPVNIFLSEPLEQFQDQVQCEHINKPQSEDLEFTERQTQPIYSYQKLKRFLKKYFIKGHNFLQRQASQNLIDADNSYMNLITDLLNLFIKLTNIERTLINNDNDNGLDKGKQLSNVIQLIQDQYSRCFNGNGSFVFQKVIRNEDSVRTVQVSRFERNHQLDNAELIKLIQRKYEQIRTNQSQWSLNAMSYLVSHAQNHQSNTLNNLTITNHHKPISLSHNKNESSKHNIILNFAHKIIQTSLNFQSSISFFPSQTDKFNDNLTNDSTYSIDLVKSHMGLIYHHKEKYCISENNKSLFTCFQVFVEVQITTNKSDINNDQNNIILKGSNLLMFQKFNHSQVNKNQILLQRFGEQKEKTSFPLQSICQVNVKIYSKQLPILQASLSFINFRLGKYLKNLLKKSNLQKTKFTTKTSKRKTIGGRFTEYLNNRKSVHAIEENIFFAESQKKPKTSNQISTLFELPQTLLFDIFRADKSYIQDEEKILHFIDEFYERNQPQFSDYILYLCVRPNFLRSSTMLKHYFANKLKYDESKILSPLIKKRLSTCASNNGNQNISQLIIGKPRISSVKPLANVQDIVEERELLNKYMKDLTRKNSLHKNQHSQSVSKSPLFSKKPIFLIKEQQRKENPKDIEI